MPRSSDVRSCRSTSGAYTRSHCVSTSCAGGGALGGGRARVGQEWLGMSGEKISNRYSTIEAPLEYCGHLQHARQLRQAHSWVRRAAAFELMEQLVEGILCGHKLWERVANQVLSFPRYFAPG